MTPDTLKQRLAFVIRRHRERRKFSQEAFADELGLHRAYYGRVENGQNLTLQTLEHVARGLKLTASRLLQEAERLNLDKALKSSTKPLRRGRPLGRKSRWQ